MNALFVRFAARHAPCALLSRTDWPKLQEKKSALPCRGVRLVHLAVMHTAGPSQSRTVPSRTPAKLSNGVEQRRKRVQAQVSYSWSPCTCHYCCLRTTYKLQRASLPFLHSCVLLLLLVVFNKKKFCWTTLINNGRCDWRVAAGGELSEAAKFSSHPVDIHTPCKFLTRHKWGLWLFSCQ